MTKTFFHVGLPKTATTFFQKQIFPYLSRSTFVNHEYILQNHAFNKLLYANDSLYNPEEVKAEIRKIKTDSIIFSGEFFSGTRNVNYINRTIIAKRLSKLFPEAEIIIFLRGQESMLTSLYNQAVKRGATDLPIEEYIWRSKDNILYERYINEKIGWNSSRLYYHASNNTIHPEHYLYYELIDMYYSLFNKVHVFLFEEFRENSKTIVKKILSIIDDELVAVKDNIFNKKVNPKLPERKLDIKRYENKIKRVAFQKNRYLLKASAFAYFTISSIMKIKNKNNQTSTDYVHELVKDFYLENNHQLINKYPHIPIIKYPQYYQL